MECCLVPCRLLIRMVNCWRSHAWRDSKPISLPNEEKKVPCGWNSVVLSGYCQDNGYRVEFGEYTGQIYTTSCDL